SMAYQQIRPCLCTQLRAKLSFVRCSAEALSMTSWLTWPVEWLAQRFSHKHLSKLQKELGDARYIDVDEWARLNEIDKRQAEDELESGVKSGVLQKAY